MNENQPSSKKIDPRDIRFESPTFIDPLTGLFNRYYLDQFLPQEIHKAALDSYPLSLLMIDLDNFKKINDDYGHLCGDKVLKQVSMVFKKIVRQTDMVIRYAGDEFIILLPGANREKIISLCGSILNSVQATPFTGDKNKEFHLTLSMGYSIYPEDTREQVKLIDMADKALYLAKKRGRNRYSSAKEVTMEEAGSLIIMDSFPCPVFIDQREALGRVKVLYDKVVKSGLLQAAFVSGPSGVGKSRMLNEIVKNFKDKGAFIRSSAYLPHAKDPYYLFANGIDSYLEAVGPDSPQAADLLVNMPQDELREMGLIVPSVRAILKGSADLTAGDRKSRFLLFKAFVDFLIQAAGASPLWLIFDDIQWADEASLEIIRHLVTQEAGSKILIVCAFSDDMPAAKGNGAGLRSFMKEIRQTASVDSIKLENLSLKDTAELIGAVFPGINATKEFASLVYNATKGNPSFIEETLKSLIEGGFIFYEDKSWRVKKGIAVKDIPDTIEEIIKRRLRGLDDETKEMIIQAAVIGQSFQMDILKKMTDKNEGFLAELVGRAKSMRLVDETGKTGKFNFVSNNIQNILYSEMSKNERDKLHYKIAETLASEHKDNIYDVAGEAAFHYGNAPRQEKAGQMARELLKLTTELFDAREVAEYIREVAQDLITRKKKIVVELSAKAMAEAAKFIIFFRGTLQKFRLYPAGSSVRADSLKELLRYLSLIFSETESLVITEVEKSLVINSKRILSSSANYAYAEDLVGIMMEHGIKTIAFKKGVREGELGSFINQLSEAPADVIDKCGWASVIRREGLEHIGIDEVRFVSVDEYAKEAQGTKKLEDLMFIEFLLGKVGHAEMDKKKVIHELVEDPQKIARAMTDIANVTTAKDNTRDSAKVIADNMTKIDSEILGPEHKGRDHAAILTKVILALEPNLRNKVFRSFLAEPEREEKGDRGDIVSSVSDDTILNMIMDEYKNNTDNPLAIKEFMRDVVAGENREKEIIAKLEPRLSELGINKRELSFIAGKTAWKSLPLDRRIEMLLKLPGDYCSGQVLSYIKEILEELDFAGKKEGLKNAVSRFLVKARKIDSPAARRDLMGAIIDFVKEPFVDPTENRLQKTNRVYSILGMLENEGDPDIFASLLEIIKQVIGVFLDSHADPKNIILKNKKAAAGKIIFINQLFSSLLKRYRSEEGRDPRIHGLINSFISENSNVPFLEMLAYSIIDETAKERYDIRDVYLIVKDKLIDTLINLVVKKNLDLSDPFREFLIRKKIAGLLIKLKDVSLDRLKKVLSDTKGEATVSLIELAGYYKDGELVEWIAPFVRHADTAIRLAAVQALGEIGTEKTIEILSRAVEEEEDTNIRNLANIRLQRLKKKTRPGNNV
jgi:diguanylate cyclase (GGDEF)-like protein